MFMKICSFELLPFFTRKLPEKMTLGALVIESDNFEFWVALGCLSECNELKQHALIRGLQLDVSLANAWAYLGKVPPIVLESFFFHFPGLSCNCKGELTLLFMYRPTNIAFTMS